MTYIIKVIGENIIIWVPSLAFTFYDILCFNNRVIAGRITDYYYIYYIILFYIYELYDFEITHYSLKNLKQYVV